MRVLLAANASYVPPRGGATRSNLVWLDALAAAGHECRIIAALLPRGAAGLADQLRTEEIALDTVLVEDGFEAVRRGALTVFSAADPARRSEILREQVREFRPDWVLVSSEDVGQVLLAAASRDAAGRIVYLGHTPQFFPFGPESWNPDPRGADLIREAAGVVVLGEHMRGYVERNLGRSATVVHPPIYGRGPWPSFGRFDRGLIAMVNPCAVKGISIFLALARALPEHQFAAVPGWGTTRADFRALEALPNVTLLPNRRDIDDIFRLTRVLLMPSLWYEGFGLTVMEAMLRGIPALASDSGGLVEAKAGTGFVLPVRPIQRYEPEYDERNMPRAIVPEQDVTPWIEAVRTLFSNRELYETESRRSQAVATRFATSLNPNALEGFLTRLAPKAPADYRLPTTDYRFRVLLAHNSLYYPAHGGGDKSNRLLVEALAARGHGCCVVARLGSFGASEHDAYLADLAARGVAASSSDGVVSFRLNGVEAHVLANHPRLRAYFARQIKTYAPDVILCSTDDPAQLMLEAAIEHPAARVVYLVRATLALPFGPDCAFPSAAKTETLRQADAVVGVSEYVAEYVRKWGGMDAVHVPISLMDAGPFPKLGRFENDFVTLVNPCAVKGISIFLALADRLPDVRFAAVPTWGTNEQDHRALEARPNITILPPVDNIDHLLAHTKILLVPSLWAEARSRIVVEAMLRGVPVLASDIGGIPEAKMGVPYLLPVRAIEHYRADLDEQMVPVAEVPPQDIGPWEQTLRRVLSDRGHHDELSRASRKAAMEYVSKLSIEPFEALLSDVIAKPRHSAGQPPPSRDREGAVLPSPLAHLSPEKRRLLTLRLKKTRPQAARGNPWFPTLKSATTTALRLFCFPHAGAGAAAFAGWGERLPKWVAVCPAQLPGRETRMSEQPFRAMRDLIAVLGPEIALYTDRPFAFFGHSMGAGIAFELARWLRRNGESMPLLLLVSAARAPQCRLGHVPPPEPPDAEFLEEIRRREGIPSEILADAEAMRLILPTLKADTALYRNYVYEVEPPLGCPIRVYGGAEDPNVSPDQLAAWREQTTASVAVRTFPGGHFFIRAPDSGFYEALAADLEEIAATARA